MIGFVGLSHLGIVSSIAAAAKGFRVLAYDADARLCSELNAGRLPVLEPDLPEFLAEHRDRISFSHEKSDLADCELVFLSRDVPTDARDQSQLAALDAILDDVIPAMATGSILVVLCQVPPGFTRALADRHRAGLAARGLNLFYQVETLIFGNAVARALYPERYIIGCADPVVDLPAPYARLLAAFDCPVLQMRYESAELAKISINVCLVASVSAVNTLAELCEATGADWQEIVPALKLDKRIGPHAYLQPGLGIAGGNLERDLATVTGLAAAKETEAGVVEAFVNDSRYRRDWALRKLRASVIDRKPNSVIAVWGLAYKPDTHSTKNSPALALVRSLGDFAVNIYDPEARLEESRAGLNQSATPLDACAGADVLVVMTPWSELASVAPADVFERVAGHCVIDPYGALDRKRYEEAGFEVLVLGR